MKNKFLEKNKDLVSRVKEYLVGGGRISISSIQRKFRLGFSRAAEMMDALTELGVIKETPTDSIPKRELVYENLSLLDEYVV